MLNAVFQNGVFVPTADVTAAIGLTPCDRVVSLIGSGGKTSLMLALAEEAVAAGKTVVITTTTHVLPNDYYVPDRDDALRRLPKQRLVLLAAAGPAGKLTSPGETYIERAAAAADLVLIEADGSKRLPLKYPAAHEPLIHPLSDLVVLVAGLSALGRPWQDVCHRVALAAKALGVDPSAPVKACDLPRLLRRGYAEVFADRSYRPHVALNQADKRAVLAAAGAIADALAETGSRITAHSLAEAARK